MRVVADEMRCPSIHCAEQKCDIVFIDGIMTEVEIFDFHDFGQEGELADEGKNCRLINAAILKFDGVLGCDVPRDEKGELTL